MIKKIFLIGNPNVGKSVVFSRLTGVAVMSSNYPGTTVEFVKGYLTLGEERVEVIDLPGTYSLQPTTSAEEVAVNLLHQENKNDIVVINILDATNLERNLYLTLQLIEEGFPVIVCLNMCDDTRHRGITIDEQKLEEELGMPVVSTCAVTGYGIKPLIERIRHAFPQASRIVSYQARWQQIGTIISHVQQLTHKHHTLRELLEDVSVGPLAGWLMAGAVVYSSFKVVRFIGETLITRIADPFFFTVYQPLLEKVSAALGGEGFLHHVLIGELIKGRIDFKQSLGLLTTAPYIEFAMVLPYVIAFYFILSILEDSGYLPRLAMLLDNVLHRLGLHGFAIIPVLLGFGCNVPGILATRVLESKRERFIAATLISIGVPCVALQAMIFWLLGRYSGWYVAGVYLVLFSLLLVIGMVLNRSLHGFSQELLLEIPPYRFPPLAVFGTKVFYRIKGFLIEAVPVVFLGVLLVNVLVYARVFDAVTAVFAPLLEGLFGLPRQALIALVIGFLRKDVAAGMLATLGLSVKQLFISATLLSISFPCIATFVVLFKELGLRALVNATLIMLVTTIIIGIVLNVGIR